MFEVKNPKLKFLLNSLIESISNNDKLPISLYEEIQDHPEYGLEVLELLPTLNEIDNFNNEDELSPILIACFNYIELCLFQLKSAQEHQHKWADKLIEKYQQTVLTLLETHPELHFWNTIINLFFEADLPLNDEVKETYLEVIEQEVSSEKNVEQQRMMVKALLSEEHDASEFEIAELFFSQTNALPNEYFPTFLAELLSFNLPKATDTAVLFLLHPVKEVRLTLLANLNKIFSGISLTPKSLSRLLVIRQWVPEDEKAMIESLLALQRKQGGQFAESEQQTLVEIKATERDGSGTQALFLLLKSKRKFSSSGLLLKKEQGVKDCWITSPTSKEEASTQIADSHQHEFFIRKVDKKYLKLSINDHLYQGQQKGYVPNLYVLQLQEMLGEQWHAEPLPLESTLKALLSAVPELEDPHWITKSLQRSGLWQKKYSFCDSWFEENPDIDKLVNQCCNFTSGIKHCDTTLALPIVLDEYFEKQREQWLRHFVWVALWAKAHARANEYLWKDCVTLVKKINEGTPFIELPIMQLIAEQSIFQSIETMETRKTHLS